MLRGSILETRDPVLILSVCSTTFPHFSKEYRDKGVTMSHDELHTHAQEVREAGRAAITTEHPLVMAGVLLRLYGRSTLPIERTALAYVIAQLLESTAQPGAQERRQWHCPICATRVGGVL
jgi:hypothetical protein